MKQLIFLLMAAFACAPAWSQHELDWPLGQSRYLEVSAETKNLWQAETSSSRLYQYRLTVLERQGKDSILLQVVPLRIFEQSQIGNTVTQYDSRYPHPREELKRTFAWQMGDTLDLWVDTQGQALAFRKHSQPSWQSVVPGYSLWFSLDRMLADYTYYARAIARKSLIPVEEADREMEWENGWLGTGQVDYVHSFPLSVELKDEVTVQTKGWIEVGPEHPRPVCLKVESNASSLTLTNIAATRVEELNLLRIPLLPTTSGGFAGEIKLAQPQFLSLYTGKNRWEPSLTLFVEPGDTLHIRWNPDQENHRQAAHFEGRNASANQYLNSPHLGDLRQDLYHWDRIEELPYPPAEDAYRHYQTVSRQLLKDLDQARRDLPAVFVEQLTWKIRYLTATQLLEYYNARLFGHSRQAVSEEYRAAMLAPPLLNSQAYSLLSYWLYLRANVKYRQLVESKYRYRRTNPYLGWRQMYHSVENWLTGYPLHKLQAMALSRAMDTRLLAIKDFQSEYHAFMALCQDTALTKPLARSFRRLQALSGGQPFVDFVAEDESGQPVNFSDGHGQKRILRFYRSMNTDPWFDSTSSHALVDSLPEVTIWHVFLGERPDSLPDRVNDWAGKRLFVSDSAEQRRLMNFLHYQPAKMEHDHYARLFFIDEEGMIATSYPFQYGNVSKVFENGRQGRMLWHVRGKDFEPQMVKFARTPPRFRVWGLNWREFSALLTTLGVVLVLTVLFLLLRARYLKRREARRRQLTELELRAIRAQLNPHFVFNAMGSIQHLVQAQPERANHYLAELAELMRRVLYHTRQGRIPLSEELETVRRYVALEALRKEVELHIALDDHLEPELIEVPALLLQPYVENAILHGLLPLRRPGRIEIRIEAGRDRLHLHISDDGVGLHEAQPADNSASGLGLRLTAERLRLLYGPGATVQVYDRSDLEPGQTGTLVSVGLPLGD